MRLTEERKQWRKDHPYVSIEAFLIRQFIFILTTLTLKGFYAKPSKDQTGALNLMEWEVGIPGKEKVRYHVPNVLFNLRVGLFQTIWEGGIYKLLMIFPDGTFSCLPKLLKDLLNFFHRVPNKAT